MPIFSIGTPWTFWSTDKSYSDPGFCIGVVLLIEKTVVGFVIGFGLVTFVVKWES